MSEGAGFVDEDVERKEDGLVLDEGVSHFLAVFLVDSKKHVKRERGRER